MTTQNDKAKASSLRARAAVAAWRDQNPAGTAGQLTATLSGQFHRDYGPVLRAVLFAAGRRWAREVTGMITGDAVPGRGR